MSFCACVCGDGEIDVNDVSSFVAKRTEFSPASLERVSLVLFYELFMLRSTLELCSDQMGFKNTSDFASDFDRREGGLPGQPGGTEQEQLTRKCSLRFTRQTQTTGNNPCTCVVFPWELWSASVTAHMFRVIKAYAGRTSKV